MTYYVPTFPDQRAEGEWWAGPVGQAVVAHQNGHRFYQARFGVHPTIQMQVPVMRMLAQIEDNGWRLEQTGYVSLDTNVAQARGVATGGRVDGIYLFRRVDADEHASS